MLSVRVVFIIFLSLSIECLWLQVPDWAREAGRAERGGAAHPADPGAGALAEGDDGAAL